MYEIKRAEKMIPSGLELPSKATAIPLKPLGAITLIGSYVTLLPIIDVGAKIANAPPRPANAPAIIMVTTTFLLPFIPA